jgi:hypothetical protein
MDSRAEPKTISSSKRDPRVDVLRGIALIMIFIDHIPGDFLNNLTLRNFGFCDAAEIFVLLAGFASMTAYGKCFERDGAASGLRRVGMRCVRLYLFQIGLLVAALAIRRTWTTQYGFGEEEMLPLLEGGLAAIGHVITLRALPPGLDILPLYIVLLTCFPLGYAAVRLLGWRLALAASALVWAVVQVEPRLNLVNTTDDTLRHFNPFAWQFVFAIGAVLSLAMRASGGSLPRRVWLAVPCWLYLFWAFLQQMPWGNWGLPDLRPLNLPTPDKTNLSPLSLLDVLALSYLVLSSPRLIAVVRRPAFAALEACGKHSLEVFSLGTLLSLIGQLAMDTFGIGLFMQVAVNLGGLAAMVGLAFALERGPGGRPAQPAPAMLAARYWRR